MKNMLKSYKTDESITPMNDENITIPIKAEFPQNQQKSENITKQTVSESFCGNLKLQNETYLENQPYKTNSLNRVIF